MVEAQTYHAPANRHLGPLALVTAVVGAWWWLRPFRIVVEGDSMRPTFSPGDRLVATRRGRVRVGTIVVFEHPERPGFELIKRVAAASDARAPVVPRGLWLVGDNPAASTDSRTFGPVPPAAIRGVVRFRYGRA